MKGLVVKQFRMLIGLFAIALAAAVSLSFASPASASDPILPIHNASTSDGECLEPDGGSFSQGVSIVQEPCTNGAIQDWDFISLGGTSYRIRNVASGLCLDAFGGATNGTPIVAWPCANISNQKWDAGRTLPGIVPLVSQVAGSHSLCLDVPGGQNTVGLAMQLFSCNLTATQDWIIEDGISIQA
jgi:hypothetical protein